MENAETAIASPNNPPGEASVEALQNDALAVMMGGKSASTAETPVVQATPAEPVTPEVTEPKVEATEENPEAAAEAAALAAEQAEEALRAAEEAKGQEGKVSERIRIAGTDEDKALVNAANLIVRAHKIPFAEAMDRVLGRQAQATVQAQTQVQAEPEVPQVSQEVQDLEATVADLEAKLDEAGASEGLFNSDIAKLTRELSRANAKLETAQVRAEIRQQQQQGQQQTLAQLQTGWKAELESVKQDYPDMGDEGSFLYLTAKRFTDQAKADPKHPNHADLSKPNAPRIFAELAAKAIKLPTVKPAESAPVVPAKTPSVKTPSPAPVAGFRTTTPPAPAPTAQETAAKALSDAMSVMSGAPPLVKRPSVVIR